MRFPHKQLIPLAALALALSACGSSKTFDVQRPREPIVNQPRTQAVNMTAVADEGIRRRQNEQVMFLVAAGQNEEQPDVPQEPRSDIATTTDTPVSVAATPSSPWDCIAEAETGSDYSMTGSTYSTAFGMVNDIIEDYGTPEEQAAVFSGTASKETQIRIASAFAAENGFGGWGELTKQKCGL